MLDKDNSSAYRNKSYPDNFRLRSQSWSSKRESDENEKVSISNKISSKKTSSTLSLHIEAYENEIEASKDLEIVEKVAKVEMIEYLFPRQNFENCEPEIMPFKTSQKLMVFERINAKKSPVVWKSYRTFDTMFDHYLLFCGNDPMEAIKFLIANLTADDLEKILQAFLNFEYFHSVYIQKFMDGTLTTNDETLTTNFVEILSQMELLDKRFEDLNWFKQVKQISAASKEGSTAANNGSQPANGTSNKLNAGKSWSSKGGGGGQNGQHQNHTSNRKGDGSSSSDEDDRKNGGRKPGIKSDAESSSSSSSSDEDNEKKQGKKKAKYREMGESKAEIPDPQKLVAEIILREHEFVQKLIAICKDFIACRETLYKNSGLKYIFEQSVKELMIVGEDLRLPNSETPNGGEFVQMGIMEFDKIYKQLYNGLLILNSALDSIFLLEEVHLKSVPSDFMSCIAPELKREDIEKLQDNPDLIRNLMNFHNSLKRVYIGAAYLKLKRELLHRKVSALLADEKQLSPFRRRVLHKFSTALKHIIMFPGEVFKTQINQNYEEPISFEKDYEKMNEECRLLGHDAKIIQQFLQQLNEHSRLETISSALNFQLWNRKTLDEDES